MATSNKTITDQEWALLQNIGALYREMREEAGMTQREAATSIGTSQARLPILEHGQADVMITTLNRWANVYGYQVEIGLVKIPSIGDFQMNEDGTTDVYTEDGWELYELIEASA